MLFMVNVHVNFCIWMCMCLCQHVLFSYPAVERNALAFFQHLKKKQWTKELKVVSPNEAAESDLRLVHSASYLRSLKVCADKIPVRQFCFSIECIKPLTLNTKHVITIMVLFVNASCISY